MKLALSTLAALVASQLTFAQVNHPIDAEAVQAVLATDRQFDRAWNDKDVSALDHLWADDYLFIGWASEIMNKQTK
jgi:hypothetical protein